MTGRAVETTVRQTLEEPMQSIEEVKDHAAALCELVDWRGVGILHDDQPSAVLIVLLDRDSVVAVCRVCLSGQESADALQIYLPAGENVVLRCCQGCTITREDVVDLATLTECWQRAVKQSKEVNLEEVKEFFERVEAGTRRRGRDVKIKVETARQVWFEAHGRCMFEGCGKDLTLDPITGHRGNFAYLAHNVAASETGPRGILYLSGLLADEASNILLLCDVHHRLVDTVAKADYPAERLSEMRRQFCDDADELLEGLTKPRIPAFCISWPVHRQVISAPSALQIAQALTPIGARLDGQLRRLNDNEKILRDTDPEHIWPLLPNAIDSAAADILAQSHTQSYRAALFAMGLMPALIALGAKLGNKSEVIPMLRHRENGLWYWPNEEPQGEFYTISDLDNLNSDETEVVVELALTARPKAMTYTALALDFPIVTIQANDGCMGNGALSHPTDGNRFRQRMQELMHQLRNEHGVQRIHLLPCASNAACVFFGQAFDSYHPKMVLYDFNSNGDKMVSRLALTNIDNRCIVKSTSNYI